MTKSPAQLDREIAAALTADTAPALPAVDANTGQVYQSVARQGPGSDVAHRFVGRCKKCGTGRQITGRVLVGRSVTRNNQVLLAPDGALYTVGDLGTNPYKIWVRCGDHHVALARVTEGTKNSKHACGARCTSSTGPNCDCRCRGANHGSNL